MKKEFIDIPGYEGLYSINKIGEVLTLSKKSGSVIRKTKKLKHEHTKQGYARVRLYKKGKHKSFSIHRLVLLTFIGPSDKIVNHKDGNKLNNNIYNLEYCTYSYNNWHTSNILNKKPTNLNIGKGKLCHNSKLLGKYKGNMLIDTFYGGYEAARSINKPPQTLHKHIKKGDVYMGYIRQYI